MSMRLVVGIMAIAAILLAYLLGGGAGTSISYQNGVGTYEVSSSGLSLLASLLIFATYSIALEPAKSASTIAPAASGTRRAAAWFIDFFLALTALTSVLALIPLTLEAVRTGTFVWQFRRSDTSTSDVLVTLLVVGLSFIGMGFYWAIPVLRGAQTVGQCILAIRVVPAMPTPFSPARVWLRGVVQPFAPFLWLAKLVSGKYWHDEFANTRVVKVLPNHAAA